MPKYKLFKIKAFDAHGGLSPDFLDNDQSLKKQAYSSTKAGRYVIHSIEKHTSASRWIMSTIAWGTPVKFTNGIVYVQQSGKWVKLRDVNAQWARFSDDVLHDNLLKLYTRDYMRFYGKKEPDTWIFNDFGHVSIKYFKDLNSNYRLDKSEQLMSDFIHTTPVNEAITFYNRRSSFPEPVLLSESHGCIHVKPADIDAMATSGYIEKGTTIEVHPYNNTLAVENIIETDLANPKKSFEIHFYPLSSNDKATSGSGKLVVYSINKNK